VNVKSLTSSFRRLTGVYKNANVAVKASLWFTFCSVFRRGISVITMPIFTRIMTTEQFGTYNIFLTWYNIIGLLVTLNIHMEIFNKGLIDHKSDMDGFMTNQIGLLIVLTAGATLLYGAFYRFWNGLFGMTTPLMLVMLAEILANGIMAMWYARKHFDYNYKQITGMTVLTALSIPLLGIIAVMSVEQKAEAKIVTNAAVPFVISAVLLVIYMRRGKLFANRSWWKVTLAAALPLVPHYLSLVLLNQSDKLMIDWFIGKEAAAIYSVAHSAGLLMTIINTSINGSFVPWAYNKLKAGNGRDIRKVANSLLQIAMFANIALIWVAPEAIRLLAAPQYASAVWCLVPIALSVYFYFAYTLFVDVEIYYGANKYIAVASVCATVMNLVLNYIFIPIYGFVAAGYTTLFSYAATMVLHCLFLRHVLHKNGVKLSEYYDMKTVTVLGAASAAAAAVAMLLYPYWMVRYGLLAAAMILAVIKRKQIMGLIRQIRKK